MNSIVLYRDFSLYSHNHFMNLIKMQIPLGDCGSLSSFVENCLATVGVCVFYASASAGAFFNLIITLEKIFEM